MKKTFLMGTAIFLWVVTLILLFAETEGDKWFLTLIVSKVVAIVCGICAYMLTIYAHNLEDKNYDY